MHLPGRAMPQASWRRETHPAWLVVVCGVLLVSTTWAAVPFIEVPADGSDPGPEARTRYSKGIFDWAPAGRGAPCCAGG